MPLNYTSRKEMEAIFSAIGVDTRLADDSPEGEVPNPTEEAYLVDCQYEATDEIALILGQRYSPKALSNVRWVRRTASWMACFLLSQRRGNPKQFVAMYEKALIQLNQVADGKRPLFDEDGNIIPTVANLNPSHGNLVVDDYYSVAKLRVQRETSSGGTHPRQDKDDRRFMWNWGM